MTQKNRSKENRYILIKMYPLESDVNQMCQRCDWGDQLHELSEHGDI